MSCKKYRPLIFDVLISILGVALWYNQFVYDAHLNTPFQYGGSLSTLCQYSTNNTWSIGNCQPYNWMSFNGVWSLIDAACTISAGVNISQVNYPYGLQMLIDGDRCYTAPNRAFTGLFQYRTFIVTIVCLWVSVLGLLCWVPLYFLATHPGWWYTTFRTVFVISKVSMLLIIPLYCLYRSNNSWFADGDLPTDILAMACVVLVVYYILWGYAICCVWRQKIKQLVQPLDVDTERLIN